MRGGSGVTLSLLPVLFLLPLLYGGGLLLAIAQSFGLLLPDGANTFTLAHYRAMLTDSELHASLLVTLLWATAATALSLILGLAVALALRPIAHRSRFLNVLLQAPIAIPHLAMAILALHLLGQSGLIARLAFAAGLISEPAGFPEFFHDRYGLGIILTYTCKEVPFVALIALAMLRRAGTDYESLAATLGASPWQRFRHVTLPLVAPPLVSATLIVFAFLFGAFEVPFLLGRTYPSMLGVLAQRRFMSNDLADRPGAVAIGVLMSVFAAIAVYFYLGQSRRLVGERPTLF